MRAPTRALRRQLRPSRWCATIVVGLLAAGMVGVAASAAAGRGHAQYPPSGPAAKGQGGGSAPSAKARRNRGLGHFDRRDLVSDQQGKAQLVDPHLKNAWGLAFGPTTPGWVADNHADVSTLYTGATTPTTPPAMLPLVVDIPGGEPTGLVFNGGTGFTVKSGPASGAARFLFSSESGRITGWNPTVPAPGSTHAQIAAKVKNAIFKGLAINASGTRLYATDFHHGKVDVWDQNFAPVRRPGAFRDRRIPKHYAPFGIEAVGHRIVVTYARQDKDREDDQAGPGRGFVDFYSESGRLLRRFARRGPLNSPWGIAKAPQGFGAASGDWLIGNFGNGRILAYSSGGRFLGALRGAGASPIVIEGLWALKFGNGVIGSPQTLLFTAGPGDEAHGLFGAITAR